MVTSGVFQSGWFVIVNHAWSPHDSSRADLLKTTEFLNTIKIDGRLRKKSWLTSEEEDNKEKRSKRQYSQAGATYCSGVPSCERVTIYIGNILLPCAINARRDQWLAHLGERCKRSIPLI